MNLGKITGVYQLYNCQHQQGSEKVTPIHQKKEYAVFSLSLSSVECFSFSYHGPHSDYCCQHSHRQLDICTRFILSVRIQTSKVVRSRSVYSFIMVPRGNVLRIKE
jgi:hypothetical protein